MHFNIYHMFLFLNKHKLLLHIAINWFHNVCFALLLGGPVLYIAIDLSLIDNMDIQFLWNVTDHFLITTQGLNSELGVGGVVFLST